MAILPADAAYPAPAGRKVLLVVAHPDDEYAFAATTYRLAREPGATVDQVVVTNGESGCHYSALAELVYGVRLTDQASARARLPEIRRQEARAAGRILGIRRHYFLGQPDGGASGGIEDAFRLWDSAGVLRSLEELMRKKRYDFVFTTLPTPQTHAHHKAAAVLTLRAVSALPEALRPVVLAADPDDEAPAVFTRLPGYPLTRPIDGAPVFAFDRRTRFGFRDAYSYQIPMHEVCPHIRAGAGGLRRHGESAAVRRGTAAHRFRHCVRQRCGALRILRPRSWFAPSCAHAACRPRFARRLQMRRFQGCPSGGQS